MLGSGGYSHVTGQFKQQILKWIINSEVEESLDMIYLLGICGPQICFLNIVGLTFPHLCNECVGEWRSGTGPRRDQVPLSRKLKAELVAEQAFSVLVCTRQDQAAAIAHSSLAQMLQPLLPFLRGPPLPASLPTLSLPVCFDSEFQPSLLELMQGSGHTAVLERSKHQAQTTHLFVCLLMRASRSTYH